MANKLLNGYKYIESESISEAPTVSTDDWSDATKELLDTLPQVWTRGLLYFLVVSVTVILPWAMLSGVDETGTARGRLEPKGKTFRLDSAVSGTVSKVLVKEGDSVNAGQSLLLIESQLVNSDLQQAQEKLQGQLNQLSQLNLLKNQLVLTLTTVRQQNQAQELEKQAQLDQAQQNLNALINAYHLQKEEKLAQVEQARQTLSHAQNAKTLVKTNLASALREVQRYQKAQNEGVVAEIDLVGKKDVAQEKQKLYEQSLSDIEQAKLRFSEQQSSYERTVSQASADIEQAQLRIKEQASSYQSLTQSGKLAVLKSEEQLKNQEKEITALQAEIAQTKSQLESLRFQLGQRVLVAPVSGTVFQLPIQRAGAVVQPGTMIADIAPAGMPLVVRAQMPTTDSGFLRKGLVVKLKFDAYPFQDYGVMSGKLVDISPTTLDVDTPNGKVAAYNLEIAINQRCIPTANKCIELRPGDTATAEVIVRQRRIIDFLLDPFKQLQQGGLKL